MRQESCVTMSKSKSCVPRHKNCGSLLNVQRYLGLGVLGAQGSSSTFWFKPTWLLACVGESLSFVFSSSTWHVTFYPRHTILAAVLWLPRQRSPAPRAWCHVGRGLTALQLKTWCHVGQNLRINCLEMGQKSSSACEEENRRL